MQSDADMKKLKVPELKAALMYKGVAVDPKYSCMYTFLKALSELYSISKIVQMASESVPLTVTSTTHIM